MSASAPSDAPSATAGQRLDQWLWFARLAKSRTLAQALIERNKIRVNRVKAGKPSLWVKPGDVVTLSVGPNVRVVEVMAIGVRRGPALEAARLFRELTPAPDRTTSSRPDARRAGPSNGGPDPSVVVHGVRPSGAGRPTKRERRATERLKDPYRES
jgi:ribosome-associated heat shock protein Hsp15